MITKNSFVIYKSNLALVTETNLDKFTIRWQSENANGKKVQYAEQKVREKDVVILYSGKNDGKNENSTPSSNIENANLEKAIENANNSAICNEYEQKIAETYELLLSEENAFSQAVSIDELALISLGKYEINSAWAFFTVLQKTFFFKQCTEKLPLLYFIPRTQDEIFAMKQKESEKQNTLLFQEQFIERLKQKKIDIAKDGQYLQEIEAFALGKTEKSKYLALANFPQNPEKAHKLLLDVGFWDITKNPYPTRFGLSMNSARIEIEKPPFDKSRIEISCLSYAIDNENSDDPDDAIGFDGKYLWIHVADPACTIKPNSKIDIDARERGTTLYMPEGISRMINDSCFIDYALGLTEKNIALSFKILLDESGNIIETEILKTYVRVKRLTYIQAQEMKNSAELKKFFEIAAVYHEKRLKSDAVEINIPHVDVKLTSDNAGKRLVSISPELNNDATQMVKEMMLIAGEAASKFALKNNIPFPYISTEKISWPKTILSGLAGQFQLLRCMKGRTVSVNPSMHCMLGISTYCQVTSPLRRYIDLIAHQQLHLFLEQQQLIDKDELLERISEGDAGIVAANKASRFSELHFKLVYLMQNPDWQGNAVAIDQRGNQTSFYILQLAMDTQIVGKNFKLNQEIIVKATNINLPELKVDFVQI